MIRRTKIVATLGPATGNEAAIGALLQAGTNVIRINASHGTTETRAEWIAIARRVAERTDLPLAVLLDLQGPRIRVGDLSAPRELTAGQHVVFAPEAAQARLMKLRAWMQGHQEQAIVVICLLLGLWLTGNSIYQLTS